MRARAVIFLLACCTLLAACGGGSDDSGGGSDDGPVTLTFENYNAGTQGLGGTGTEILMDAFTAEHPDIDVEVIATGSEDILTSVQTKAAAGDAPDIAQLSQGYVRTIAESLPWVPIDSLATDEEWDAYAEGLVPAATELCRVDGELVGMPYTVSTATMYYNADLFRQAGLDPDAPPSTWAEVKDAALRIAAATDAHGVVIPAMGTYDFLSQSLIMSNGGEMMDETGTEVRFDRPEAVEAIEMYQDLVESGAHPGIGSQDATAAFEAGQIGMYVNTTAILTSLADTTDGQFELRTAAVPGFEGKPVRLANSGACVFVLTDDPAKQAAAWEFVEFVTGKRGYTIITSEIGYVPMRTDIIDDPEYLGTYLEEHPLSQPSVRQVADLAGRRSWGGPRGLEALAAFQESLEQIVMHGADAESTLSETAERVQALLP